MLLSRFSRVLTLCDHLDCSPPGSSVLRSLKARIMEWVTKPSSRGSSWPRDQTRVSYVSCIGRQVFLPLAPPGKSSKTIVTPSNKSLSWVPFWEPDLQWGGILRVFGRKMVFLFTIQSIMEYVALMLVSRIRSQVMCLWKKAIAFIHFWQYHIIWPNPSLATKIVPWWYDEILAISKSNWLFGASNCPGIKSTSLYIMST